MNPLSIQKNVQRFQPYFFNLIFFWGALFIYVFNPYYAGFLLPETQKALFTLVVLYTIGGLITAVFYSSHVNNKSHTMIIVGAIQRVLPEWKHYLNSFAFDQKYHLPKLNYQEKTSGLFLLVKLFFLPLMLNSIFGHLTNIHITGQKIDSFSFLFTPSGFIALLYPLLFSSIFLIDTIFFFFGYLIETKLLNNEVKSVEPTVFGWIVALICYPPFSSLIYKFAPGSGTGSHYFSSNSLTIIMLIAILLFLLIYLWATVALGAKCSNLTNRGIVTRGPYRYVRHPAYVAKNLSWWIGILPVMSIQVFLAMLVWSFIYFLRAITEERHLLSDPEYQKYCKKVRYRFIPGFY